MSAKGSTDPRLILPLSTLSATSASDLQSALVIAPYILHSSASKYVLQKGAIKDDPILQDMAARILTSPCTLAKLARINDLVSDLTDTPRAAQAFRAIIGFMNHQSFVSRNGTFGLWQLGLFDSLMNLLVEGNSIFNIIRTPGDRPFEVVKAPKRRLELEAPEKENTIPSVEVPELPTKKVKLETPSRVLDDAMDTAKLLESGPRSNSVPSRTFEKESTATSSNDDPNIASGTSSTVAPPLQAALPKPVHPLPKKPAFSLPLPQKPGRARRCGVLAVPI